ncbi:S1/P1 nuclease [Sphingomonas sp. GlSt437]|uniref:S1/P1 nuclease n=1 Tax=Sphingomonas sp. GlSt437 TaxID=3389970 RepID=UPI003A84BCAD
MIRSLQRLLAALALVLLPQPVLAYGAFGHATIARIAMANVSPVTRAKVLALMAKAPLLETPTCKAAKIDDLSVWPDCIRALGPRFSYTAAWHYQDVDICAPFTLKPACRDGNCVSAQIDRQIRLLKDKSLPPRERLMALAFLVHFTGDLHMPLHAGEHNDAGGNQVSAGYGIYAPDRLNLHSVWDGPLAERAITDGPSLVRHYSTEEAAPLAAGTIEDWSRESWQLSRDIVYSSAGLSNVCTTKPSARAVLDDATIARLVPVQRLQVQRAGLRLARELDEAFGS